MQGNNYYFLKMSGGIAGNKEQEFGQTVRFVVNLLPPECVEHSLKEDVQVRGYYCFYTLWKTETAFNHFIDSQEYKLIEGAFNALGFLDPIVHGKVLKL